MQNFVTFAISNNRIYKTLEISLPGQLSEFFHTLWGITLIQKNDLPNGSQDVKYFSRV
jgi:hypothetical protein